MQTSRSRVMLSLLVGTLILITGCQYMPWLKQDADAKPANAKLAADTVPAPQSPAAKKPVSTKPAAKEPTTSLYERLGGEKSIKALVDDFVARAASDTKLNFTRKGTTHEWAAAPENIDKLKVRLVQFFCVITGGPQKYEGKDMSDSHKGMQINDAEFDAFIADLKASLEKVSAPEREQKELLEIVASTRGVIVATPATSNVAP